LSAVRSFGEREGASIHEVTLTTSAGAEARIITWGAVLRDLVVPGPAGPQRVVLGLETLADYVRHSPFFGAIIGRYANRIGDARFRLDGREVGLVPNENGNELHGGPASFGRRPWALLGHTASTAHLALVSEDDEMGFPGRLFATCTYELLEPATLRVTLQAFADEPTPVNLTAHNYFNLDGSADARDHVLQVASDFYTPVDGEQIPTGEIRSVAGTPVDFREPRRLRPARGPYSDIDHNLVLRREASAGLVLAHAATLCSRLNGLAMELWTTEPGLQVYDGRLVEIPVPGVGGAIFRPYSGIALEPQRFPDSPNHPYFPNTILLPGCVSRQVSEFRFGLDSGSPA
jgi:aldose 1-epimerase